MLGLDWPAWALLGAGLLVVVLEIFFASAGLLGLVACACLVAGGWFAAQAGGIAGVGRYAVASIVGVPIALLAALKILPRTPMGRRMRLQGPTVTARMAADPLIGRLIGTEGVAETDLRPAGIARLGGERHHVVTRGSHVVAGTTVRVLKVEGNHVIVEARTM